jgi:Uma2 family endonuclease
MVQFIELIAFVFTYGLKYRNKCEVASIPCFCFPTDLLVGDVEVYRIGKPKEVLQNPSSLDGEDVLSEFVLDLTEIW